VTATAEKPFILVDGSGYIFRAFFALKQTRAGGRNIDLSTSYGMPTGAIHVFASMLMRLYLDERPERCVVVFDSEKPTFRHALDPNYKATRRERPPDLIPQFPWFEKIARAFHLPVLKLEGVEADDVIATVVRQARARGLPCVIYGADKDLMPLVVDANPPVRMIDTMRDIDYDEARVKQKFGVPPRMVADWLSLRGDSTDNIPGVSGVGEVTATKLLQQYGSIDEIIAHAAELKGKLAETLRNPEELANLELSRKLVALKDDVELPVDVLELRREDWDARALAECFRALEFNRFLARLESTFVSDRSKYHAITALPALEAEITAAQAAHEFAVELELSAPESPMTAAIIGIALAVPNRPAAYIPVGHRYLGAPKQLELTSVIDRLKPLLEDPSIAKTVTNHKQQWLVWHRHGVDLTTVKIDPMIASYILDASQPSHGLDALSKQYLNHDVLTPADVIGKGRDARRFDEVDVQTATLYGAEHADVALAAGKLLRSRVEGAKLASLHDDVEIPLGRVLAIMEETGVKVDVGVLHGLGHDLGAMCTRLEREIHELAGKPVNVGSPKQLGELLFDTLGLGDTEGHVVRRTKTGAYSTDAEALEELVDRHPIVAKILEHRELSKLKSTYLDALPPMVNPKTGRLHTSYQQTTASTGRLASTNPNIQNIPIRTALGREIRRAFVAEPGWTLVSCDYSQIELRVIAHLSDDRVLVEAFSNDIDVHAQTAAEVFGVPLAEVTTEQRRVAKAVNYGLGYGQSDFGLSRAIGVTREEARKYIDTYFARFAGVREYMEHAIAEARKSLLVTTLLGRRLPLPALSSRRWGDRAAAERVARNAPIQGTAADLLKIAMLKCQKLVETGGMQARMLLTVHDELVFEVIAADAERFAAAARVEMETAYDLKVPLKVDVGISETWAGAH
jgi:DNA polymerase-1